MSTALVIGVGGLGCPAALELAENGVDLILVDPDRVELSNLQRQVLFSTEDIGTAKVDAAAAYLRGRFPERNISTVVGRVDASNVVSLLGGLAPHQRPDVVLDCTDDPASRFVVGDAALAQGTPAVLGGVLRFDGLVLAVAGDHGPCFRCLFEEPPPPEEGMRCGEAGVLGALCGVVGHMQAERALGLVGAGTLARHTGFVTTIDGLRGRVREVPLPEATDCPACGGLAARLDITAHACPMTFVRTRLALEAIPVGATLDIVMRAGEPARNVPRSLREEGHRVLVDSAVSETVHRVVVRRALCQPSRPTL